MLSHTLQTLANGLPILRIPMPGVESVTVLVLANTGSRYEAPAQYGIAHFFEHLVFKGTHKYPTAHDLAITVDGVGADFNAFTGKEYTGYYVKAAARHVELALDVVSDMLLTPQLRQADIDREKGVIIEEIHMYEDTPARYVGNLFDRLAFAGSGLGHDVIGTAETVSSLTTADFQEFLRQWYGLPNLLLVIAGNEKTVGAEAILKQAEAAFDKQDALTKDRVQQKVAVAKDLTTNPHADNFFHLTNKATEQAHFVLGWPGLSHTSPDRYALTLLNIILGANMSSRLFTEIREKRGLAYYVRTMTDSHHETGVFGATVGADPQRVEEALQITIQEFVDLAAGKAEKLITSAELTRAKEFVVGKMALSYEDSRSMAQFYGLRQLLLGKVEPLDELLSKIKAVSLAKVQALITKLIQPGQLRVAVIGPFTDEAKFTKYLG